MVSRLPIRAVLALALAVTLWASGFAGIRAGLHAYAPAHLALLRYFTASMVLAAYARLAHFRRPALRDIPRLMLAGFLGITFYNLALNYGETKITAGAASLLVASTPIWTALLAIALLRERLSFMGWMGVVVSFAGVGLIANGDGGGIQLPPEAVLVLAAAMAWAADIVLQKR